MCTNNPVSGPRPFVDMKEYWRLRPVCHPCNGAAVSNLAVNSRKLDDWLQIVVLMCFIGPLILVGLQAP